MASSERILITGATGTVGHVLVPLLKDKAQVTVLTRGPSVSGLPAGVKIVRGDLRGPDALAAVLDWYDAVFLVWPFADDHGLGDLVDLIADRARRVVYLSSAALRDHEAQVEQLIKEGGLEWTFLRPRSFASNALRWAEEIRSGQPVKEAFAAAGMAIVDPRDVASVAQRVLREDGHTGAAYELTGPEILSKTDQVRIIGETIGRATRLEEISVDTARRQMLGMGWPAGAVDEVLEAQAGLVYQPDAITPTIEAVLGERPHTFRSWVSDHIYHFKAP